MFGAWPLTARNNQWLLRESCIQPPPSHGPSCSTKSLTDSPIAARSAIPSSKTCFHCLVESGLSAVTSGVKKIPPPHIAPAKKPFDGITFVNCDEVGHVLAFSITPRLL